MKTAIKNTITFLKSLHVFFTHDIWVQDFSKLSRARAIFYQQILIIYLVGRAFVHDRLLIRASALVYATLLSIVPLLAVMFSLLKGFGFHNKLESTLNKFFEPLGQQAVQTIVPTIVNFVNNVKVGALGTVGFFLLFLSVWSIVNNIERAFNDVWKIRKVRSIHRRFTDYISVLIVGPLLVFVFVGVVASLQSFVIVQAISKIPGIPYIFNKIVPFTITWLFFYFVLTYVPNTKVKLKPAMTGSAISAVLWVVANYFFAHFIVSAYQYGTSAAIYAGFATLPLFLLWMFISWAIMLLGVELSYVYQNLDQISWEIRDTNYSHSVKNELALKIVLYSGQKFYNSEQAPTASEISDTFNCPLPLTYDMLSLLVDQGILYIIDREPPGFVPAKSLEKMFVDDIFNKVQTSGINKLHEKEPQILSSKVLTIMDKYNKTLHRTFSHTSILDLIKEEN